MKCLHERLAVLYTTGLSPETSPRRESAPRILVDAIQRIFLHSFANQPNTGISTSIATTQLESPSSDADSIHTLIFLTFFHVINGNFSFAHEGRAKRY